MRKEQGKPNVIFILSDQQRWDTAGVHGNPLELTPHFDWMASRGTLVEHAFSCQPVCGPARACVQTGLYASTTGYIDNNTELPASCKTIAHYFGENGYETALIGKWHVSGKEVIPRESRFGYDYWLCHNKLTGPDCRPYRTMLYNSDDEPVVWPGYRVDAVTDAAIDYMFRRRDPNRPFYLNLAYIEPHQQTETGEYAPPDIYRDRYTGRWTPPDLAALGGTAHQELGLYYGCVKRLDEALGRLLDALRSMNLLENTVIAYTSDHGNHFNTRNAGCKRSCHESSIRVPLALYGGDFTGGGRISEPVSLIDLPPTLLDAAGIGVPPQFQGRSILPLARREKVAWPGEAFVQISQTETGRAIRTDRWKYGVTAPGKDPRKDVGSDRYVETYLYHLGPDPYELRNLVASPAHREVCERLRRRLIRRMVEAGEPAPIIEPATVAGKSGKVVWPEEMPAD